MIQSENRKINKREYWKDQIKKWQESNISQSAVPAILMRRGQ